MDVHWMYTGCTLDVLWMCSGCTLHVDWMYTGCILDVDWMYTGCTPGVHWMCTGCTLDVHWMCTRCTLDVHWMYTGCRPDTYVVILPSTTLIYQCHIVYNGVVDTGNTSEGIISIDMKGSICHFTKWQMLPFISNDTFSIGVTVLVPGISIITP